MGVHVTILGAEEMPLRDSTKLGHYNQYIIKNFPFCHFMNVGERSHKMQNVLQMLQKIEVQ
jgi:hypothetical protein